MVFYHGTTKENWKRIQEDGALFGVRKFAKSRATYLTTDIDEAKQYGEILLQVEYDPSEHSEMNNYTEGCWQCRVYEPIPIDAVKELNEKDMAQEEKAKAYGEAVKKKQEYKPNKVLGCYQFVYN